MHRYFGVLHPPRAEEWLRAVHRGPSKRRLAARETGASTFGRRGHGAPSLRRSVLLPPRSDKGRDGPVPALQLGPFLLILCSGSGSSLSQRWGSWRRSRRSSSRWERRACRRGGVGTQAGITPCTARVPLLASGCTRVLSQHPTCHRCLGPRRTRPRSTIWVNSRPSLQNFGRSCRSPQR